MSKTDDIDTPVITGDYRMMTAEIVLDDATEDGEAITWGIMTARPDSQGCAHSCPGAGKAWTIKSGPLRSQRSLNHSYQPAAFRLHR